MLIKLAFLGFIVALIAPAPTRADGTDIVAEYNVKGIATITGANECSPLSACAETLDFSFVMATEELSDTSNPPYFRYYALQDSAEISSLGPLGEFSLASNSTVDSAGNYLPFVSTQGDEIDLIFQDAITSIPTTPDVTGADLFSCGVDDAACLQDFPPHMFVWGEVDATVAPIAAPEPSSLLLSIIGIVFIASLWKKNLQTLSQRVQGRRVRFL